MRDPADPSFADRLQHAAETQEAVTFQGSEFVSFKTFLGDTLIEDLQDLLAHITVTVSVEPFGPIMDCSLRVQDTGSELRRLKLGLYALSNNRLRLTNRQDDHAHVIVTIDFPWSWSETMLDEDAIWINDPVITIKSRPIPTRNVRQILELYAVLRALKEPRTVELYDIDTSEVHFIGQGTRVGNLNPDEETFIDALQAVQNAFPMKSFPIPEPIKRDDVRKTIEIAQILCTGHYISELGSISAEIGAETLTTLLTYADNDGVIGGASGKDSRHTLNVEMERTEHEVFGVTLDLGPSQQDLCSVKLVPGPGTLRRQIARLTRGATIPVRLVPADRRKRQVACHYSRYKHETPV